LASLVSLLSFIEGEFALFKFELKFELKFWEIEDSEFKG
jgi:hypothetical protein